MTTKEKITKARFENLQKLLKVLKLQLSELDDLIKFLAEEGKGWRFNNQLGEAMSKFDETKLKIKNLEEFLQKVEVVEKLNSNGTVQVGSTVMIKREDGSCRSVTIVQDGSSDIDPQNGVISERSPLGIALLGHKIGENLSLNNQNIAVEKIQ